MTSPRQDETGVGRGASELNRQNFSTEIASFLDLSNETGILGPYNMGAILSGTDSIGALGSRSTTTSLRTAAAAEAPTQLVPAAAAETSRCGPVRTDEVLFDLAQQAARP
jgi:hypothetical protein